MCDGQNIRDALIRTVAPKIFLVYHQKMSSLAAPYVELGVPVDVWATHRPSSSIADIAFTPISETGIELTNDYEPVLYQANRSLMTANAAQEIADLQTRNHATTAYSTLDCHATPLFSSATWAGMGITAPPAPGPAPFVAVGGIERMLAMADARAASVTFANHAADGDPSIRPLTFQVSGRSIEVIRLAADSDDPDDGQEVIDDNLPQFPANACNLVRNSVMTPEQGAGMLVAEVRREPLAGGGCGTWLRLTLELFPVGRYAIVINDTQRATLEVRPDGAYDMGFYNIGVRPTFEDLGIGALGHAGTPLSWTRRVQLGLPTPEFDPPVAVPASVHAAVNGAFKTPTLRNIDLTGPYFHNGGVATLRETIELYNRGGDFHAANAADLSPQMVALGLRDHEIDALVSFLRSLTDERVRMESAPFDHPELPLPNGRSLPPVGAAGRAALGLPPLRTFEERIAGGDATGDLNQDGSVDGIDLGLLLASWGPCPVTGPCSADLNGDRNVDGMDLGPMLASWGSAAP